LSEEVVLEAEKIIGWWNSLYITPTSLKPSSEVREGFVRAIAAFQESKVSEDEEKIEKAALDFLGKYSACLKENLLAMGNNALVSMELYKVEAEKLRAELESLREESAADLKAQAGKYEDLLKEYSIMKGRYEEVAERLDKKVKQNV
jgi:hypothetical protein